MSHTADGSRFPPPHDSLAIQPRTRRNPFPAFMKTVDERLSQGNVLYFRMRHYMMRVRGNADRTNTRKTCPIKTYWT